MKLNGRFIEKGVNAVLMALTMLATGVYSCLAQGASTSEGHTGDKVVKNTENYIIKLAKNLNLSAKAHPIETVNSPFAEYKPAIALHGNRLYFSRSLHPQNTAGVEDLEDIWYSDIDKTNNNA